MTTVGETLEAARTRKKLTLDLVERATHIRQKFLEAIESNEFEKLPPGTFAKGIIKNYASFLGLSVEETMAFYRRQVDEEKIKVSPSSNSVPIFRKFSLTPQLFTFVSVVAVILLFFAYLIISYFKFAGAPVLLVSSPKNNIVVSSEQIEVVGKTDPDASLLINSQQVPLSEDGGFDVKIPLQPGLNSVSVTAENKFKRQSTVIRNVRLER